jgi:hypothetical protein
MMTDIELARFEAGLHDEDGFTHAEHVRIAFELTTRYEFDEALHRYATGLRRLTARLGTPDRFHATITTAFMALVAERCATVCASTWDGFAAVSGDILDKRCLAAWYSDRELASPTARRTFVLPASTRCD